MVGFAIVGVIAGYVLALCTTTEQTGCSERTDSAVETERVLVHRTRFPRKLHRLLATVRLTRLVEDPRI